MELDTEAKKQILQRILAKNHGLESYDVIVDDFSEGTKGIYVYFLLEKNEELNEELITWWDIAMKA